MGALNQFHDGQSGLGGGDSSLVGRERVFTSLDGEQTSESCFDRSAAEARAAIEAAGGFEAAAHITGYSVSALHKWCDPKEFKQYGRMPPFLKYLLGPDALLASAAHMQLEATRLQAHAVDLARAQLKLRVAEGNLADAQLTNEPASVQRPLVAELVEAALRLDSAFATCRRCHAEMFASAGQCDACGTPNALDARQRAGLEKP